MKLPIFLLVFLVLPPDSAHAFGKKKVDPSPPAPVPAPPVPPAPAPVPPPAPVEGEIPAPTPGSNFLSCLLQSGGTWAFGSAPVGCSVSPAQNALYASAQYAPVVFHDSAASARSSYMNAMYALAREVGTYYLRRRNPQVGDAELAGFLAGFYALLNQETYWTHYRLGADTVLRYMRGDALHGFGIMQVDDRSHSVALNQGKGVDLLENMIYGLDIYYAAWVRSATASCVSSATAYDQRARAAWSAYNGGPSQLCRWKGGGNSKDAAYFDKFQARAWLGFVADPRAPTPLDVVCLAEGKRPCAFR